jgi:hypothetical protein
LNLWSKQILPKEKGPPFLEGSYLSTYIARKSQPFNPCDEGVSFLIFMTVLKADTYSEMLARWANEFDGHYTLCYMLAQLND